MLMVGEISEAIREQSTASSIIARQVERIAQMSEENNATAHGVASNSNDLSNVAQAMRTEVAMYTV